MEKIVEKLKKFLLYPVFLVLILYGLWLSYLDGDFDAGGPFWFFLLAIMLVIGIVVFFVRFQYWGIIVGTLLFLLVILSITGWTIIWGGVCDYSFAGMCFEGVLTDYEVGPIARFFGANTEPDFLLWLWNGITILVDGRFYGIGFIDRFFFSPIISWLAFGFTIAAIGMLNSGSSNE